MNFLAGDKLLEPLVKLLVESTNAHTGSVVKIYLKKLS